MFFSRLRQIPAVIALTLGISLALAAWSPAYGQAYRVQSGDSLWKISQRYGVTIAGIKLANGLSSDLILAGQYLELPALHTAKRGDTLFLLARQYGKSVAAIMKANGLTGSMIFVGQKLTIPVPAQTSGAQRVSVSAYERELLARAVYSEARGEPFLGQVAVAAVILNRAKHPDFPDTISGVIFQPRAITAVHDGQFWLTPNQTAFAAAEQALAGSDPSGGALFYYNPVTATNQWIRSRPITTSIGRHVFAR